MKKLLSTFLIIIFLFSLTGCYQDFYRDSLDDYIGEVCAHAVGFSDVEIDNPQYFLPSLSFFDDFAYVEGDYVYYEADPLREIFHLGRKPEIALLTLTYEEQIYSAAKQYMLDEIPSYDNVLYAYQSFSFYENANFVRMKEERRFPEHFTMAGYSDEKHMLVFLGFYQSYPGRAEVYRTDIKENWVGFMDEYFGPYYDFSE